MDIAQYLADLLHEYDEVGIPGLGVLGKKKIPASYNRATGKYDPPSVRIRFTEGPASAELLNKHISVTKNISLSSSEFFSSRFGEEARQKLDEGNLVELSTLGSLRKTPAGIIFEPAAEFSDRENFGLDPVAELDAAQLNDDTDPVIPEPEAEIKAETEAPSAPRDIPDISDTPDQPESKDETVEPAGTNETDTPYKTSEPEYTREIDETASEPDEQYEPAPNKSSELHTPLFDKIVLKEGSWNGETVEIEDDYRRPARQRKWVLLSILLFILLAGIVAAYLFNQQLGGFYKRLMNGSADTVAVKRPVPKPVPAVPLTDTIPDSLAAADSLGRDTLSKKMLKKPAGFDDSAVYIVLDVFKTVAEAEKYRNELKAKGVSSELIDVTPGTVKVSTGKPYKDFLNADPDLQKLKHSVAPRAYSYTYYY